MFLEATMFWMATVDALVLVLFTTLASPVLAASAVIEEWVVFAWTATH